MAHQTLIVEIDEHVGMITLNRPEALNALNTQMLSELADAITLMNSEDRVHAIVITGSEKAFAAGADISEMAEKSFVDMFTSNFLVISI